MPMLMLMLDGRDSCFGLVAGEGWLEAGYGYVRVGDGRHDDDDGDDDGSVFHQELIRRSYSSSIIGILACY